MYYLFFALHDTIYLVVIVKETFKNLKKVFKKYGREYKGTLIKNSIFSLFGIFTNICIPIFSAKFIINFTDSKFEQAIYMSLIILVIYAVEIIKIMLIRRNNQILRRGIVKNIQMSLGREILRLEQTHWILIHQEHLFKD